MSATFSADFPSWARINAERRGHVDRVATLVSSWADEMAVADFERARWLKAAVLHDSLKDAPAAMLDELASEWWDIRGLRHGPAAAVLAERNGETDEAVLDAIRYHSVGYARWQTVGRILYMADYLEHGREFHSALHGRLSAEVPSDPDAALRAVAQERLSGIVAHGLPLLEETTEFWNSLVCGS